MAHYFKKYSNDGQPRLTYIYILAYMYWDTMRRIDLINRPPMSTPDRNILPELMNPTQYFHQFYHMERHVVPEQKRFNFHKLAESATDDQVKRKTKPKKEYICRLVVKLIFAFYYGFLTLLFLTYYLTHFNTKINTKTHFLCIFTGIFSVKNAS